MIPALSSPHLNETPEQQEKLEAVFEQAPKPSHAAHQLLATKMGVSPQQTKVWFRDARQRKRVLGQGGSGEGLIGHSAAVREQFAPDRGTTPCS